MTDKDIRQSSETYEDYRFMLLTPEKLSVAIHIVTGHLSAQEPLREDMRRAALKLVKDMRVLVSGEKGDIVSDTTHLKIRADAIISGLYVAKSAKMISAANAEILEREYFELVNYFGKSRVENINIENNISNLSIEKEISHPTIRQSLAIISKGQINKERPERRVVHNNDRKEGVSRKEIILNIIQGKNSYSLSDIASRVGGVSEKTIQRDLLGLVEGKVLKKTGERRWSRYSRV